MKLATVFGERKDFWCFLQETQEKLKKMLGFTEVFIQGSDNFKTSALSDHDKSKMLVQAINDSK